MQKILRIDPKDNLIVALRDLAQGDIIENEGQRIQLVTDVPAKHKFTREPVPVGGIVTLYGVPVGKAVAPLQSGERITVDNVVHYAAEVDLSVRSSASRSFRALRFSQNTSGMMSQ